ncbi:MAG: anti-sigma factor antagonist [Clostridia bacterium]|nr:anti-sigma factor antagonist [Clostridia bacterium]
MQKTALHTLCIALEGELDHHNAPALRRKLDAALDRSRSGLILDFSRVTLMDSSGIGLLIGRYKRAKDRGGKLYVQNVSPHIDKLFRMSGLYSIIEKL